MAYWVRRFQSAFMPLDGAPAWIREERPPARDVMEIQGSALARVGFQGDSIGMRRLTRPDAADTDLDPGEVSLFQFDEGGALAWALPMDLPWSGRTLGVLVARGGTTRRTEYHHAPGMGWTAVLNRLQGAADSAGFGRAVPNVRRGRVQAIPSAAGPVWVQTHYRWPPDGAPSLAGVVVSTPERTLARPSLMEALGGRAQPEETNDAFRERVARLYDAMQAAQRNADWRAYGEAWSALGRLLGRP
jgi:hypothetical protein